MSADTNDMFTAAKGCLIVVGLIVLAVVGCSVAIGGGDDEPQSNREAELDVDAYACRYGRDVMADADVLTVAELRAKFADVHDDTYPGGSVRPKARAVLAALTAGDVRGLDYATRDFARVCDKVFQQH